MDPQVSGLGQRFKANRFASTLVILATLTLGILIGTVVSGAVKGKEQNSSSDATPLKVPSPVQMSNQFSTIARRARALGGKHQHRIDHQESPSTDDASGTRPDAG